MELRHIRYFVAVAEAGSFRRAAEALHVAQPALSRQIAALEDDAGIVLFEPGSRRRVLSAAGEAFLEDARAILADVERALQRAKGVSRGEQRKLRIAFTEIASDSEILSGFIEALRRAMPATEIVMLPMPSNHQIDALLHNRIDAGFLYGMPQMEPRVVFHGLADDPIMAAFPRANRLARRGKLFLRDLAGMRLIFVSRNVRPDFHRAVLAACRRSGLPPLIEEVASAATVASLVSVGMGVGLLTSTMKSRLPEGVVMRPIADFSLAFRLGLAWCPEHASALTSRMMAVAEAEHPTPRRARVADRPQRRATSR
jgi:DNA-binding transcriptional LysR family regulator